MSLPLDSTASNMEIASSSGSPSKLVYLRVDSDMLLLSRKGSHSIMRF